MSIDCLETCPKIQKFKEAKLELLELMSLHDGNIAQNNATFVTITSTREQYGNNQALDEAESLLTESVDMTTRAMTETASALDLQDSAIETFLNLCPSQQPIPKKRFGKTILKCALND